MPILRHKTPLAVIALLTSLLLAGAGPPSSAGAQDWRLRYVRVQMLARRLLAANLSACPKKRYDFGFASWSLDPEASPQLKAARAKELGLGDGLTVIAVHAGGPAMKAGLQVGDVVRSAGSTDWSDTPEIRRRIAEAVAGGETPQPLQLKVRRGDDDIALSVTPEQICAAEVVLTSAATVNAATGGSTLVIEGGLERLLTQDDELAFVIAHEAAHLFVGDAGDDRVDDRRDPSRRSRMEKAADALALRLMLRAGFAPEAASSAHARIAAARGPISRLLDLHGPYMSTRERISFLVSEAAKARAVHQP